MELWLGQPACLLVALPVRHSNAPFTHLPCPTPLSCAPPSLRSLLLSVSPSICSTSVSRASAERSSWGERQRAGQCCLPACRYLLQALQCRGGGPTVALSAAGDCFWRYIHMHRPLPVTVSLGPLPTRMGPCCVFSWPVLLSVVSCRWFQSRFCYLSHSILCHTLISPPLSPLPRHCPPILISPP